MAFSLALLLVMVFNGFSQNASNSTGSLQLKIDVADDNGVDAVTQVVILKNLVASEIEPFIQARLSRYGAVQVNDPTNTIIITDKPIKVKDLVSLVQKLDESGIKDFLRLETEAIKLKYIAPSRIKPYIEKRLSTEGIISYNDELNLLIITDLKSRIENIKKTLPQFDIMPKQVAVELRVYDVTSIDGSKTGLDLFELIHSLNGSARYSAQSSDYVSKHYGNYDNLTESNSYTQSRSSSRNMSADLYADYDQLITAIEQNATRNNIYLASNPVILVQNRNWGQISSEVQYYYQYSQNNGLSYNDWLNVSVYPKITEADIVELNIRINFENYGQSSFDGFLESNVTTTNNKTVLLGRISKKVEKNDHRGIPFLKDMPVLGFLFGKQVKITEGHQFLVLATPHIYNAGTGMTDSLNIKQ
jgi:type IV pilus assembly protein PilQ